MMEKQKTRPENCSVAAIRYAKVLVELRIPEAAIRETADICWESVELMRIMENPVVSMEKKHAIIDRIFPQEIRSFLKVVNDYGKMPIIHEIFQAYEELKTRMEGIVTAKLRYVVPPSEDQKEKMTRFLCEEFDAAGVQWEMQEDAELIGGFVLQVNGKEYDYSMQGRLKRLEQKLTWR